jgi:CBS domain-containing protein
MDTKTTTASTVPAPRRTTVRDVMTTQVVTVRPETPITEVTRLLREHHLRGLPVLGAADRPVGVVADRDLLRMVERGARRWWGGWRAPRRPATAGEVMSTPLVAVRPDAGVAEAARTMRQTGVGLLAVVEPQIGLPRTLIGVLGRSDLLSVFERDDAELRNEIVDTVFAGILCIATDRVQVRVSDGVVTLAGRLATRTDKHRVHDFVERLEGVVAVVDELTYDVDDRVADAIIAPPF